MITLISVADYHYLFQMFGIKPESTVIVCLKPGVVTITIHKQKIRAWWYKKKIKREIETCRAIGTHVEVLWKNGKKL